MNAIDLWNTALSHAGHDAFVTAPTETSKAAQLCNLHHDAALRGLLAAFDWKFARKETALALRTPDPPSRWQYRYARPDDCVEPRAIDDGRRVRPNDEAIPFEPQGQDILTDQPDAVLLYTATAETVALYPAHFFDALAWDLASRIAMPLTKSPKLAEYARNRAAYERRIAMMTDANKGQSDPEPDGEFVRARQ